MMKSRKKEFKRKYFGSLTHQLILISICLVTGTLLLCWFINTVFLEPYYVINKQNTLLSGFETIDEASEAGTLDDSSFDVTFDNLCANGNITVMIISSDRTIVRSSVNDTQKMMLEFMNIIFGEKQNEVTVMMQSDNYIIQKQTDTRLDSEFLVLYGTLSNGNLIQYISGMCGCCRCNHQCSRDRVCLKRHYNTASASDRYLKTHDGA